MDVLSLFDGISIARQALKNLNIPVEEYYSSEVDKYAIQISEKNFPEIKRLGTNPQCSSAVAGQLLVSPVALRNRGEGKQPEYNRTDKANSLTTVQTDSMVQEDFFIRKLTPIECERLQSLPDNYTEGISNTQRYKCLGNGFNCKVIEHILTYILNEKIL